MHALAKKFNEIFNHINITYDSYGYLKKFSDKHF